MIHPPASSPVLHSTALYTASAQALAAMLPTDAPVTATLRSGSRPVPSAGGHGAGASFVGELSADVLVHVEAGLLGGTPGDTGALVSGSDVLRPALEASTGVLGAGVLSTGPAIQDDALLGDGETVCFDLASAGESIGFFALRIRENAAPEAARPSSAADRADVGARLGRINSVEMALTVEIGRTRMSVRDVLNLETGAVVELDRSAGAPADVLLNGRLIAHGEVVVMDQDYGIRITKILDVAEGLG